MWACCPELCVGDQRAQESINALQRLSFSNAQQEHETRQRNHSVQVAQQLQSQDAALKASDVCVVMVVRVSMGCFDTCTSRA